jgi:hypothetical protein
MDVSPEMFEAASARGKRLVAEYGATAVRYDRASGMVKVSLRSKQKLRFLPSAVRGLERASPEQLASVELGPAGVSLYFPELDVDLSIPGLIHDADGKRIIVTR